MVQTATIYAVHSPADPESVYVGKANDVQIRFRDHLRYTGKKHSSFGLWLRDIRGRGLPVELVILEVVSRSDWREAERFWRESFRVMGVRLLNSVPGGHGGDGMDSGARARHSEIMKKTYSIPHLREKMVKSATEGRRRAQEKRVLRGEKKKSGMTMERRLALVGMSLSETLALRDRILGLRARGLRPSQIVGVLGDSKMVYPVCSGKHWSCKI